MVSVQNTTELYTLRWLGFCCVHFTSIKKQKRFCSPIFSILKMWEQGTGVGSRCWGRLIRSPLKEAGRYPTPSTQPSLHDLNLSPSPNGLAMS